MTARTKSGGSPARVTKNDWLKAALRVLASDGIGQVLVLPLAAKLKVSRSSFYWYFRNRQDLLDQLIAHWTETNTRSIVAHAGAPSPSIIDAVLHVFECWVDEKLYSPELDFAIRNWARQSVKVRKLVEAADEARLTAIRGMFSRHGYDEEDSFIRARVLYFMQVGYYVLDVREPIDARLSHVEAYLRAFTGQEPTPGQTQRFRDYARRSLGPPRRP